MVGRDDAEHITDENLRRRVGLGPLKPSPVTEIHAGTASGPGASTSFAAATAAKTRADRWIAGLGHAAGVADVATRACQAVGWNVLKSTSGKFD